MRKIKLCALLAIALCSCVGEDAYDLPDLIADPVSVDGDIITIAAVKGLLAQREDGVHTFQNTNHFMEGYVISSDEAGNFFEELILQDRPENPTAGISVQIDVNPLFTRFDLGRKVFVRLDGLTAALANGTVQLGYRDGAGINNIPRPRYEHHLIRTAEKAALKPLPLQIGDFSDEMEHLLVHLEDVQFAASEFPDNRPSTYAAEPSDEFDGERMLESCTTPFKTILSTSTFADFNALKIPDGRGSITGILTRDFYDDFHILKVNLPTDIVFTDEERCEKSSFSCENNAVVGSTILFQEDFEAERKNRAIAKNGWTNFVEAGSETWEAYSSNSSNASLGISARMGAYGSGDRSNIGWLVTPAILLDDHDQINLQFKTSTSFADGSELQVLISTNWDGVAANIPFAEWQILKDAHIAGNADDFTRFYSSGIINLSCGNGTAHIAFRYTGNTQLAFDGTYELDDILITAD